MPKVFVRGASYEYAQLKEQVFELLDSILGNNITYATRVLIKPNLLAPASPEKAMLTHPMLVRATAEYVLDKGARPVISDSPAMGTFEKVLKESGLLDALEGLEVQFKEFRISSTVEIGEPFNRIELAEDALNADLIINLPKLKTHAQMMLTLGVKNLFGCVIGFKKPEWHFRAGVDRELFAALIVRIYMALKPAATILDGVLAMEGQGPGRAGVPKRLGVLMASDDAMALDIAVCRMLGLEPDRLLTVKAGRKMGIIEEHIEIVGQIPQSLSMKMPKITPLIFGPRFTQGLLRRYMVQRPVLDEPLCKSCGDCWKYCPASAISHDRKKLRFDYDRCIRCYCCVEVCPRGALKAREPLLGKMVSRIMNKGKD